MKKKYLLLGWIPLLLLALWMAFDMFNRWQRQELWGYRPLALFLGAWGALVLWRAWRRGSDYRFRRLGLATLSGVLLGIGFPDIIPLPLLMFVGFVPLLIVEGELRDEGERSGRRVFRYAYHAFILWNIIATYWVANTALAAGILAIVVNSALMSIPFLLFHYTTKVMPRLGYAPLVAYWIVFEYVHLNWDLNWPWLTLGNSFAEYPSWVQWYEWTGAFGGSLWVLVVNVLVLQAWRWYQDGRRDLWVWWRPALLVILPILASYVMYVNYDPNRGDTISIGVIQPNFEPHYVKFELPEDIQLERLVELSRQALAERPLDYVVYPETSFGFPEERTVGEDPSILLLRRALIDNPDLKLITGINAYHDFTEEEELSAAVRERRGHDGNMIPYEVLNAAIQLGVGSGQVQTYRKSKLVPGPESFPFGDYLFFLKPIVDQLDGTTAGLGIQPERSNFTSPEANIAPVICYESIFGEYFTGYVRKGANAAFVMTNDGWWDNTGGHRQHLYFSSLRAIETRRPVIRSANTGISAFINQRGDIEQTLGYGITGYLTGEAYVNDALTFYVRWGDLIARTAIIVSVFFLLNAVSRKWLSKAQARTEERAVEANR